jgi:dCMP deaminase
MKQKFFNLAKKLSLHSTHPQHKLAAVVTRRNKVISLGFNKYKTSPRSPHPFYSLHAEVSAIINAKQDLQGCSIYVYRETKNGTLGLSRPCHSCLNAIQEAGIKVMYYCTPEGYKEEIV